MFLCLPWERNYYLNEIISWEANLLNNIRFFFELKVERCNAFIFKHYKNNSRQEKINFINLMWILNLIQVYANKISCLISNDRLQ